ncbi:uncharacterized protein LOC135154971 [Lytechinus pictus]|uniref:uncharacterized protein LOC135154971 n=1 Tax=Lytechinus pictus TaxID=7653 RepID=UPI0030B9EA7D
MSTDFFATVRFRRNTDPELSAKLYPETQIFHLVTIFDDDLVQLRMLMACLDEQMMEEFCKKVDIPLDVVGPNKQRPDNIDLRRWRDNHLQYTVKVVFSEITGFMTNKTKVNFVTDEELDWLVFQVATDGKVEKCVGKRSKKFAKKLRATHSLLADERDGESQPKFERLHSQEGHEGAVAETAGSHKESQEEDTSSDALLQQLKLWRNNHKEKKCRKSLRSALKHVGLEECIVNKTPREKVYEVEIVRAAFHILMRDVYPVIEELGIDRKTIPKYMRQCPVIGKGSLDLLFKICEGKDKSKSYNRLDFCVKLTNMGYVDVARSIYLDHEMSISELASIASVLHRRDQAKFEPLIHKLDLRPDELPEDHGAQFETYCLEVLRTWKEKIRPVPYHYRRHIVEGLQAVECSDLADEVLTGLYRHEYPDEDVIEDICSRLDDGQIRNLLRILKLKPDHDEQDRKKINKMIVRWADKWMRKYDSSAISFKERRSVNDELVRAGFYELAHEIMVLEYSKF